MDAAVVTIGWRLSALNGYGVTRPLSYDVGYRYSVIWKKRQTSAPTSYNGQRNWNLISFGQIACHGSIFRPPKKRSLSVMAVCPEAYKNEIAFWMSERAFTDRCEI
jgi:hypothetical protein